MNIIIIPRDIIIIPNDIIILVILFFAALYQRVNIICYLYKLRKKKGTLKRKREREVGKLKISAETE